MDHIPQHLQELYDVGHKIKADVLKLLDEWPISEDSKRVELTDTSVEFTDKVNSTLRGIRQWFNALQSKVLPHTIYKTDYLSYHLGRVEEHLRHPNYQADLQSQKDVVRGALENALALIESLPASLIAPPPNAKEPSELDSNISNTHDFFNGLFATPAKHGVDVAAKYIFLDIVGFTRKRTVEAQAEIVKQLNAIVIEAVKASGSPRDKFIFIPTGDGICIGLLNIETPVDVHMQIALGILERISKYNALAQNKARRFQVRIGINANTDTLVIDINNRQNIAGAGISMASRIMGLADGDQILVGQSVYDTLRYREKYDSAFRSYRATVKHGAVLDVYQFVAEGYKGLNIEEPQSLKLAEAEPLTSSQVAPTPSEPANSITTDIAAWLFKDFLNGIIDSLGEIRQRFHRYSFGVSASPIQPYSDVHVYRIDFFNREMWHKLSSSNAGEFFLNTFQLIGSQLTSFGKKMDDFDESLSDLEKTVEASPVLLRHLIDLYAKRMEHERIPRSQFENSTLQDIAALWWGELRLRISNYKAEGKDFLVRFTAYALLGLKPEFPLHAMRDDEIILNFSNDVAKNVQADAAIAKSMEEAKLLYEVIKSDSATLLEQLKQERLAMSKRYNAPY